MALNLEQARYVSQYLTDYYNQFDRIDEYMREQKMQALDDLPPTLPGMGPENDFFSDYNMRPEDMDFDLRIVSHESWNNALSMVSSHSNMKSIPGKSLQLMIIEKNTNKTVGFILLGSPVINCKPRNQLLGGVPDLTAFNKAAIMGFVIVPVQPFGYNYLGGKLLAGICCSHQVRRMFNKKYGSNIVMMETTSLYGNSKSSSQYDGMKPFLRNRGLTDSNFVPLLHGDKYAHILKYVEDIVGPVVPKGVSSRKLKATTAIIALVKKNLPKEEREEFTKTINRAKELTEQKRYYVSNYGVRNYIDIVNGKTDKIEREVNYDRYELPNIIDWWKNKASRRFDSLKDDNRVRHELEIWTPNANIEIIR